jgi:hypothetical protein
VPTTSITEGFEHLFLTALKMAASDGITETIIGVFDVTCLYAPRIVQAHFAAFFDLAADDALSEGISPCRIDDDDVVAFLQAKLLDEAAPKAVRQRAWACLMATERVDAFSTAVRHLEDLAPAEGWWAMETRQRAGWIKMGERTDRLFQSQGYHMIFPDGFIDPEERKTEHTTWRCATEKPVTAQFGGSAGTACASYGRTLHGLLRLDAEVCAHLSVGLPGLALVCCLSCLYWEQAGLFFAHDEHGHPSPLLAIENKATPQFLREPYQSTKV